MDVVYWWVGASIVWAVGGASIVVFVAALYGLLWLSFHYWARRVLNGALNWHKVAQWDSAGRPEWKWDGPSASMQPTKTKE